MMEWFRNKVGLKDGWTLVRVVFHQGCHCISRTCKCCTYLCRLYEWGKSWHGGGQQQALNCSNTSCVNNAKLWFIKLKFFFFFFFLSLLNVCQLSSHCACYTWVIIVICLWCSGWLSLGCPWLTGSCWRTWSHPSHRPNGRKSLNDTKHFQSTNSK